MRCLPYNNPWPLILWKRWLLSKTKIIGSMEKVFKNEVKTGKRGQQEKAGALTSEQHEGCCTAFKNQTSKAWTSHCQKHGHSVWSVHAFQEVARFCSLLLPPYSDLLDKHCAQTDIHCILVVQDYISLGIVLETLIFATVFFLIFWTSPGARTLYMGGQEEGRRLWKGGKWKQQCGKPLKMHIRTLYSKLLILRQHIF